MPGDLTLQCETWADADVVDGTNNSEFSVDTMQC